MSVKPKNPAGPGALSVTSNAFSWNGREVVIPSVTDLEEVFGPADRVSPLAHKILTWDSLGIYGYISKKTKEVITLAAQLRKVDFFAFLPSSNFTGEIATPWGPISAATTLDDVTARGFRSAFVNSYKREEGGVIFFVEFKPELTNFQICRAEG